MRLFIYLKVLFGLNLLWLKCRIFSLEKVLSEIKKDNNSITHKKISKEIVFDSIESIAWRMPWVNTCFYKSLFAYSVLKEQGDSVFLKIGVRKNQKTLLAHAWLEDSLGEVLYSTEDITSETYEKLLQL